MGKLVALVTGSSRGIGRETVIEFAKAGVNVVINYCTHEQEALELETYIKENYDVSVFLVQADISLENEVYAMVNQVIDNFGSIDILVNNAGIYFEKYIEQTTNEDIDNMVDVNIKGTFKVTRNLIDKLKENKGCIVNIASCLGLVPELTSPLYCTTKAGIVMFTKCLAQEYANLGVRVNCVLPGPILTELLETSFKSEQQKIKCENRIPIKRIGTPNEVANVVAFLCSEDASYVTGGIYAVDGGVSTSSIYSK